MQTIVRWIEEYALASDNGQHGPELDTRVTALRELGRNWRNMNGTQFREALTMGMFSHYFGDAISRAFLTDYNYQAGSWRTYVTPDTAPDFRPVDRYRMSQLGTLYIRGEKQDVEADSLQDSELDMQVEEFSRQLDISWRVLLADDLGKIKQRINMMSSAASLWLDSFVSALYDNATTQATLAALGAPWAGTGRLTAANLAIGLTAMMTRTDAQGIPLIFKRIHLVVPPVSQIQAADILKDLISYGGPGGNVLADFLAISDVRVDPYIATLGANIPWYLVADPREAAAITLLRLQGMSGPVVIQKASDIERITGSAPALLLAGSFATGDLEYMVEDIVGGWDDASYVGVTDFRAMYFSSGTTP